MSNEIKDGGLAFPLGSGDSRDPCGMSLRDYFAAKAMAGMLAKEGWGVGMDTAQSAYVMADCMLRARGQS